jgi:hypothetical protein
MPYQPPIRVARIAVTRLAANDRALDDWIFGTWRARDLDPLITCPRLLLAHSQPA